MKSNANQKIEVDENTRGWKTSLLSDVAVVNEKSINRDYKNQYIEYIDVSSTLCGEILETQKLSLKDAPSRAKRIVSDNDILISTVRPNLKHFAFVSKTKPNLIASTGYAVVSSKKVNPRFLYYYLTTEEYTNYLSAIADTTTSTYPAFNPDVLEKSRIPFPSENEQQQIASILSSLDDKIELNRKMNRTLEEIGKALFKRWFVDFEFPNENGESYKSSGGEMVESELGEIPKGWEVKSLDQITEIKNGFAFKSEDYTTQGVFLLRTRNFSQTEYIEKDDSACLPEAFYEIYKNYQLQKFDVLLVMVGASVGNLGFVTSHVLPALQNQNMWNFRALNKENQLFVKYIVEKIVKENIGSASGSARDFFRKDYFRTIKYVHPKDSTIKSFNTLIASFFEIIDNNILEIERLSQLRDSLLPRLMSGKMRV